MNHLFTRQNKHRVSTRTCFHYFLISFWDVSKAYFHPWTGWWLTCPFPRQGFVSPPLTVLARSHLRTAISNTLTWHSNTRCPHWSTLVSRRGNWVVIFPCFPWIVPSTCPSLVVICGYHKQWRDILGQHYFRDGPDACTWWRIWTSELTRQSCLHQPGCLSNNKSHLKQTIRVQVVSKEGCLFKLLMISLPQKNFGEQIFKMLVTKHSCKHATCVAVMFFGFLRVVFEWMSVRRYET